MNIPFQSFFLLLATMAATGTVAGLLAGLLGVGGGIVIVPVLSFVFELLDISGGIAMHVAVGTSLATIIPTSIASLRAHHKRGAVDLALLRAWGPMLFITAGVGGVAARYIGGDALKLVFACVALLVALNMMLPRRLVLAEQLPQNSAARVGIPGVIGFISSLMGIGGGTLSVPLLTAFSYPVHKAVGTASAFGLIISVPATIGFIWAGLGVEGLPAFSLGYVNVLAAVLIFPISVATARYGARIAHSIQPDNLKRLFALFLAITALRMFWSIFAGG